MEHEPLLEGGSQGAVQSVLEVELSAPPDDVREEIAVERRVLVEERVQAEGVLGRDELVEADLSGWQGGPGAGAEIVRRVRSAVAHPLEDHGRESTQRASGGPLTTLHP